MMLLLVFGFLNYTNILTSNMTIPAQAGTHASADT